MALNIAVPLSGVGDLLEGFGLLSPISPISTDCRDNLKRLVSPVESESSGVSSLDSEEAKLKSPSPIKKKEKEIEIVIECKTIYNGRNIIDLSYIKTYQTWTQHYANLPNNNMPMFLENRSQYHRLGDSGHIQEYTMKKCSCCDFKYPVNNTVAQTNNNNTNVGVIGNSGFKKPSVNKNFNIENMYLGGGGGNSTTGIYRQF